MHAMTDRKRKGTVRRKKVTAARLMKIALDYDDEYRGGTGRGLIDDELADRIANWINTGKASPGQAEREARSDD